MLQNLRPDFFIHAVSASSACPPPTSAPSAPAAERDGAGSKCRERAYCVHRRALARGWIVEGRDTFGKTRTHGTTYTGAGPSIVMMGLRPSFFLFLLTAPPTAAVGAEFVPLPLALAMGEAVVEGAVEGLASAWAGVVGFGAVPLAGAGSEPVASVLPFISGNPAPDENQEQLFFLFFFFCFWVFRWRVSRSFVGGRRRRGAEGRR